MIPFGQAVWLWRLRRGMTQAELARLARVPRPNLSAIERGRREVSLRTLRALAAALGVRPGLLADGVAPQVDEGAAPRLSRETMERIARSVTKGTMLADPVERQIAEALQLVVGRGIRLRRGTRRPGGVRATRAAWLWLEAAYGKATVASLAERVTARS